MSLMDTITQFGGQAAVGQVAKQFGIDEKTASSAVGALLPALSSGLSSNMAKEGGTAALVSALTNGDHAKYLNDPSQLANATADGNGILGHLLGNKDVSRALAAKVAETVGIENETAKQMLPVVAAMAMSSLSKKTEGASGTDQLTDLLGKLF